MDDAKQRVEQELKELTEKYKKLDMFLQKGNVVHLSIDMINLLYEQKTVMAKYMEILAKRLEIWQ